MKSALHVQHYVFFSNKQGSLLTSERIALIITAEVIILVLPYIISGLNRRKGGPEGKFRTCYTLCRKKSSLETYLSQVSFKLFEIIYKTMFV